MVKIKKKLLVVAAGVSVLAVGSALAYWHYSQQEWCVQFTSGSGQEVTYSRGCMNPHRYRKWTLTA